MGFIGVQPASVPITSADIDDGTIQPADLNLAGNYAFTGTVTGAGQNLRPNAKPIIINGNMAVAQRGTSVASITSSGYYTVDRYKFSDNSDATITMSQESLTSGNAYTDGFANALKVDVNYRSKMKAHDRDLNWIVINTKYKF